MDMFVLIDECNKNVFYNRVLDEKNNIILSDNINHKVYFKNMVNSNTKKV
jgi:hypothetical protein